MNRILKFTLIFAVALALLAFASIAALRIMFPPEKLKALALNKLQDALKREIRIDSVGIGLRGLRIDGLEVSEAPDFQSGKFLSVGTLQAGLRLRPLLQRKIEISQVILKNWECVILQKPDGTLNISTLTSAKTKSNEKAPGGRSSPALEGPRTRLSSKMHSRAENVSGVGEKPSSAQSSSGTGTPEWSIGYVLSKEGKIVYKNPGSGLSITLSHVELKTSGVTEQGPFPLELSLAYSGSAGKTPLDGSLDYHGSLNLGGMNPAKMIVQFDPLKLDYEGTKLETSGTIQDLTNPDISLHLRALSLDKLKGLAEASAGMSLPSLSGDVQIKKSGDTLLMKQVHIVLGALTLDAQGRISQPANRPSSIDMEIKTNEFSVSDVAGIYPPTKEYHLRGAAGLHVHADGALAAPALNGDASLKSLALNYSGMNLSDISGTTRFSPASISAQITGKWNKSDFHVDLTATNYQKAPDAHVEGSLSQLDLTTLPKNAPSPAPAAGTSTGASSGGPAPAYQGPASSRISTLPIKTSGKLTVGKILHPNFTASNAELYWNLSHAAEMSKITGSAKFKISDGKFDNLKDLAEGNAMVHIALLPIILLQKIGSFAKVPMLPAFDRVNYKEITGDYAFQNGVMTVKESHLDSSAAYVTISGTADLGRDQLKLHIATKLAGELGANISGPIGFNVTGSLENPSVKVDVAAILKQPAVRKILNQPAVQDAVEQGQKLLQNLFK